MLTGEAPEGHIPFSKPDLWASRNIPSPFQSSFNLANSLRQEVPDSGETDVGLIDETKETSWAEETRKAPQ